MFPAETTASAPPWPTARLATTSELLRLRAHGLGRLLVHRDPLGRLDELETAGVEPGRAEEDRLDRVGPRLEGACDDLLRGAVAPHRVDRDAGH